MQVERDKYIKLKLYFIEVYEYIIIGYYSLFLLMICRFDCDIN